jgi:hypothetical protein
MSSLMLSISIADESILFVNSGAISQSSHRCGGV